MPRWTRYAVAFCAVLALPAVPRTADASNYDLSSIDVVDADAVARLAALKVNTTEDLWKATGTPRQSGRLAAKLKVPAATLRDWHDTCDLLRVGGIGPKVARVLALAGIRRLDQLATQDPAVLTPKIKTTNAQAEILGKLPDVDTVRTWIEQARVLTRRK